MCRDWYKTQKSVNLQSKLVNHSINTNYIPGYENIKILESTAMILKIELFGSFFL